MVGRPPSHSALQRAESQVMCISSVTVSGLAAFMHNTLVSINNNTPHQALVGRQPHLFPYPFGGDCHGGLDIKWQNGLVHVRELAAVAITETTTTQRVALDDKRNQIAAMQRSDHQPRYLVDIWYDPPPQ